LALFGRSRLCVRCVITLFPQSTCPLCRSGRNWLCFARFGPAVTPWAALPALAHSGLHWKLASFGAIAPSVAGASGHAVRHLSRPVQGKLGSFGAISPSGGSADAFPSPPPSSSVPANWVRLYNRSQRRLRGRLRPSASAPVHGANWLRFARIGSEYRVYADRTGLSRLKAVLRTVQDLCASGANLR
jgi:hypothetical protein